MEDDQEPATAIKKSVPRTPWNKGKLVGAKPPLRPSHVWSIRTKLQMKGLTRDLALFNLAIDSKLRGCDVVAVRVDDVAPSGYSMDQATIRQKKTGRPVRFELTDHTRLAIDEYLRLTGRKSGYKAEQNRRGLDLLDPAVNNPARTTKVFTLENELLQLRRLADAGLLTADEFEAKRRQIIGVARYRNSPLLVKLVIVYLALKVKARSRRPVVCHSWIDESDARESVGWQLFNAIAAQPMDGSHRRRGPVVKEVFPLPDYAP